MKVILAIEEFDYGHPEQGPSFANQALREPLEALGHEVEIFDTMSDGWAGEPRAAGAALLERVDAVSPDLVLCMLMNDELPLADIRRLRGRTITSNWFPDDVWRFRSYSQRVAPAFDWALTTSRPAELAYRAMGVRAVFLPWGFNSSLFHPVEGTEPIDVLFVGQRHGRRAQVIERLGRDGFVIATRGSGWPEGRAAPQDLARLFSSSKVNLNFLESSGGHLQARGVGLRGVGRADALLGSLIGYPRQLKARAFEIPACAAFMLTDTVAELEECFVPGREVAVFRSYSDLRRKLEYWLSHDIERHAIAQSGAARATKEHSYQARLEYLFVTIGLG